MRVLHVINTLWVGGAELHLLQLCRGLRQEGIETAVAHLKAGRGSRPLDADFAAAGVPVWDFGGRSAWNPAPLMRGLRLAAQGRWDVVHTHLPRADLVGYVNRRWTANSRWVSSVHGVLSKSWRARRALWVWGRIWRRADRVVAISNAVRDWLRTSLKVPPGIVDTVYYGIDSAAFDRPRRDLRPEGGEGRRLVIGSLGRLGPLKGHDVLVRAMPMVLDEVPEASLMIAGHDPTGYGRSLQKLAEELGIARQVRILGFERDVCSFLHSLDVFCFASRAEGFGQVLVEAMAAARPVVARAIPPISEIVEDGVTGWLIEGDESASWARRIVQLLQNEGLRAQMGAAGRARVKRHFEAGLMTAKILQIYHEVCENSCRAADGR